MPDNRRHRGAHPLDERLFASQHIPLLQEAVADFSWLLGRGYASKSALQLVGNRYQLHERQRMAVFRSTCPTGVRQHREKQRVVLERLAGATLHLDGYNVLTIIESALAGGVILRGQDGCYRDIASMHSSFRSVEETLPAIELIGQFTAQAEVQRVVWWLDSPVSNSGRLKTTLLEIAGSHGWNWEAHTVFNPDVELMNLAEAGIVVSADSVILDVVERWFDLGRAIIERDVAEAWVIDLRGEVQSD